MRPTQRVCWPGVGDFVLDHVDQLDDPCPLPTKDKDATKRIPATLHPEPHTLQS